DPAMYHAELSVADELRKAADLGYEHLELSPRADWFFWHRYPKADDAAVAEVNQVCKETGVSMLTLVPVFNWSSPDEQERDARVHQHNEIGNGDLDWNEFFGAVRDMRFNGAATVCVFGWEEDADAIHRRMLDRVRTELGS